MNKRIGTAEAVSALRAAGYGVEQMERGTLVVVKGKQCYGFAWRDTKDGSGYSREALSFLAPSLRIPALV